MNTRAALSWLTAMALSRCAQADWVTWPQCPNSRSHRVLTPDTLDQQANHLSLTHCNITTLQSSIFDNLPNLLWLELDQNKIEHIDTDVFSSARKLRYISLSDNNLVGKKLHADLFRNCSKLQRVDFSGNNMSDSPANLLQRANFHSLRVSRCSLRQLPSFITQHSFPNMTSLYLSYNLLTILHNPDMFSFAANLQSLDLGNNRIDDINKDIFKKLNSLTDVNLRFNKISFLHVELFQNMSNIAVINLSNNLIEYVPPDAFHGNALQYLYLNGNRLTHLPVNFCAGLTKSGTKLDSFYFDNNPWQCACLNDILVEVKEMGISYTSLRFDGRHHVCVMDNFVCNRIRDDYRLAYDHFSKKGDTMGSFISMVVVNTLGCVMLVTGATWAAPIIGFTRLGIAAGSIASSAHSWYGGYLGAGTIISLLMARTMG